jgi:ferredoxin
VELTVQPDQSILDVISAAGVPMLSSCGRGLCGTCEATVLGGIPDHRDSLLSDDERAGNNVMLPCVSRSCSDQIVLDL